MRTRRLSGIMRVLSFLLFPCALHIHAATVDLSTTPPEMTPAVAPNLVITLDDSSSMRKAYAPGYLGDGEPVYGVSSGFITDAVSGAQICGWYSADTSETLHPWNFSPAVNAIYYDEHQTYVVPSKSDGTPMDAGTFMAAWEDGVAANTGGSRAVRNLLTDYAIAWGGATVQPRMIHQATPNHAPSTQCSVTDGYMRFPFVDSDGSHARAFFYRFIGDGGSQRDLFDPAKYIAVDVSALGDDQRKNFAIWYGFYRTRFQIARSSLALALDEVPKNIRVQWQRLNSGVLTNTAIMRPLSDAMHFRKLMDFIYASEPAGDTPVRATVARVADYFSLANAGMAETNPYYDANAGTELSCRRNYSLLITDGGWDGNAGFTQTWSDAARTGRTHVAANPDQIGKTLPDGRIYDPNAAVSVLYGSGPSQNHLSGLADVAFHYWATDLRPDLKNNVPPHLTDRTTGVTGEVITASIGSDPQALPDEVYFNPANDPATWQHLVQYIVALGVDGERRFPDDLADLRKGVKTWPDWATSPHAEMLDTAAKVDDSWHAALNSRGGLFNASRPQQWIEEIRQVMQGVVMRSAASTAGALSTTVLRTNALYYRAGFSSDDWSGVVQAVGIDASGKPGDPKWNAGSLLDARVDAGDDRIILTSLAPGAGHGAVFKGAQVIDAIAQVDPLFASDALAQSRLGWLRGARGEEGTIFRPRSSVLGAVINAQPVYVAYPASGYRDAFPPRRSQPKLPAPEMAMDSNGRLLHSYEQFVADHLNRAPTLYVAANDGMLHAFDATSEGADADKLDIPPQPGRERWAYVPHAVYGSLRGLGALARYRYQPTVDGTPVVRDVFFSEGKQAGWHTLLVAGLRLGGRGVYALDITQADASEEGASSRGPASKVLWEFSREAGDVEGATANLGYTFGRPNIGRLANGKWVVLVPGGYLPAGSNDPTASHTFSSLFVLDAQTGALLRELRTSSAPGGLGIASEGLGTPALGDYQGDQVDDAAFAGDLTGNLWRFDLTDENPAGWKVDLLFKPAVAGDRPITVMPRLFPVPGTAGLIVVFGTGKYLGSSDNIVDGTTKVQAIYGIRDPGTAGAPPVVEGVTPMVQQVLYEKGHARGLTRQAVPLTNAAGERMGGWYVLLMIKDASGQQTNAGERVVVDATALFDSNRAVITTLMPQKADPCDPSPHGAVIVVDAATGGAALNVDQGTTGDWGAGVAQAGAQISDAPTGGYVPAAVSVGGGQVYLPGITLAADGSTFSMGDAIWRRRSWRALINAQ